MYSCRFGRRGELGNGFIPTANADYSVRAVNLTCHTQSVPQKPSDA